MQGLRKARQVILADSKDEIRSALRLLLEEEWGAEVIAEAADAKQLLQVLEGDGHGGGDGHAGEPGPLVVMDWDLPGSSSVDLLARVKELSPRALVAALSSRLESECAAQEAGADFFVSKSDPPERVLAALAGSGIRDHCDQETTEGGDDAHPA